MKTQGTWVAQSVKLRNLDLSSGFDLWVMSSSPSLGIKPTLKKKKMKNQNRKTLWQPQGHPVF